MTNIFLRVSGALILALGVTACGGKNDEDASSDSSSSISSQTSSSTVSSSSSSAVSSSSSSSSSSVPASTFDQAAYEQADGIRGGQLYSKFWVVDGFSISNSQLTSPSEVDYINDNGDFFRCKQCHGWDRLGREGGYSNRAPSATRPNVADVNLATLSEMLSPQELFDAIKEGSARRDLYAELSNYEPLSNSVEGDRMPNYAQIFKDEQILDIVKYLKEKALDTSELYDLNLGSGAYPNRDRSFSNLGKDGDASNGDQIYANNCAICHGDDGTAVMVDGGQYTVGGHVRAKPYEDQHKVRFGHLGSAMGPVLGNASIDDIKDLFKALSNAQKYPDAVQAIDGAALFVSKCGNCHTANGLGEGFSDKTGASASTIRSAIAGIPQMSDLSSLTNEEVDAIAAAIYQEKPQGQILFEGYCASCHSAHGAGAGTNKEGKSVNEINWALMNIPRMNTLNLTPTDVQLIADWL